VRDQSSSPPGSPPGGRPKRDIVLVHGVTDDGQGVKVIRQRGDRLEVGAVLPARDGQPLNGDLVRLRQRPELPLLFDVEVQYEHPRTESSEAVSTSANATELPPTGASASPAEAPSPTSQAEADPAEHSGPARVVSPPYRRGWDRIWGRSNKKPLSN